jgi:hypothetical protein
VLFNFAVVLQGLEPAMLLPNRLALLGITYSPGKRKDTLRPVFGAPDFNGTLLGEATREADNRPSRATEGEVELTQTGNYEEWDS